ncbi:c-type cytochrome [Psychromarinibacter halotolerans]|uniref:c-type cytochrome n=1 Tax=Psychromarinibacter halotolerans TaxID=1775175 RepID=UPI0023D8B3EC|nr:cytochrome c [Psychromarinibacter halotolerans]MDF0598018.1 cytochrome c [Psychromarinibacter halotolerans]
MRQLIAVLLTCAAGAAPAQDFGPAERNFFIHCSGCHGEDARGGGPVSFILDTTPPDLTKLAEQNGGVFPLARVVFRIDGRDPVTAHTEMPEFGAALEGATVMLKAETGQPVMTTEAIAGLVRWLEAAQR